MSIEEMDIIINRFIEAYWGTSIGESIYRKRRNVYDDNYSGIEEIYNEVLNY